MSFQGFCSPESAFAEPIIFLIRAMGVSDLPPRSLESTISDPLGARVCLPRAFDALDMPLRSPDLPYQSPGGPQPSSPEPRIHHFISSWAPRLPSQSFRCFGHASPEPRCCLHKVFDASDMPLQSPEPAFLKSLGSQTLPYSFHLWRHLGATI